MHTLSWKKLLLLIISTPAAAGEMRSLDLCIMHVTQRILTPFICLPFVPSIMHYTYTNTRCLPDSDRLQPFFVCFGLGNNTGTCMVDSGSSVGGEKWLNLEC
ncbi:hypothetical protein BRADI_3g54714v3 [Brachypodium distachyon]|uniref:Secreted protein n=1 Tax=Brachypodium distachyon TaxID=15368 RepID=A0A2K2D545_BRADI|nr:hypothetical protein BRADI_3g54714v3 [Brachypodium distachyon]